MKARRSRSCANAGCGAENRPTTARHEIGPRTSSRPCLISSLHFCLFIHVRRTFALGFGRKHPFAGRFWHADRRRRLASAAPTIIRNAIASSTPTRATPHPACACPLSWQTWLNLLHSLSPNGDADPLSAGRSTVRAQNPRRSVADVTPRRKNAVRLPQAGRTDTHTLNG